MADEDAVEGNVNAEAAPAVPPPDAPVTPVSEPASAEPTSVPEQAPAELSEIKSPAEPSAPPASVPLATSPSEVSGEPPALQDVLAETPTPAPAPIPATPQSSIKDFQTQANQKKTSIKRAKLEKIVALAKEKGRITNDDVQKHVYVSHVTAARYLSQLVREGRLRRVGALKKPHYEPI